MILASLFLHVNRTDLKGVPGSLEWADCCISFHRRSALVWHEGGFSKVAECVVRARKPLPRKSIVHISLCDFLLCCDPLRKASLAARQTGLKSLNALTDPPFCVFDVRACKRTDLRLLNCSTSIIPKMRIIHEPLRIG